MNRSPRVAVIAGVARNGVIGRGNTIPWHLSEDLKHFKATTLGRPVVMGRRTYESIGRPLPGRRNLVVSRNTAWTASGIERVDSLTAALAACSDSDEVFVIGGVQLFAEAMAVAQRLIITEVNLTPDGDVYFPAIDPLHWRETHRRPLVSSTGIGYAIVEYRRAAAMVN